MKVDNFVLLIISIVTLIVISLLTECNRGRLIELENKATKEIVETFFHLGSADPTQPGQWGYQITGITQGKYGGRSRSEMMNSFGTHSHNVGGYLTQDEFGSSRFGSSSYTLTGSALPTKVNYGSCVWSDINGSAVESTNNDSTNRWLKEINSIEYNDGSSGQVGDKDECVSGDPGYEPPTNCNITNTSNTDDCDFFYNDGLIKEKYDITYPTYGGSNCETIYNGNNTLNFQDIIINENDNKIGYKYFTSDNITLPCADKIQNNNLLNIGLSNPYEINITEPTWNGFFNSERLSKILYGSGNKLAYGNSITYDELQILKNNQQGSEIITNSLARNYKYTKPKLNGEYYTVDDNYIKYTANFRYEHPNVVRNVFVSRLDIGEGEGEKDYLFTGSHAFAKMWDISTGTLKKKFWHGDYIVYSVFVSRLDIGEGEKDYLFTGSYEDAKMWDINATVNDNGVVDTPMRTFGNFVWSVFVSGDYLFTGSNDNNAKMWDISTGNLKKTFEGHEGHEYAVRSVFVSGDYLFTGSYPTAKMWDISTGNLVKTFEGHSFWVNSVFVSGDYLFTGSWDWTAKMWDINATVNDNGVVDTPMRTFSGHSFWVNSVFVSGDYLFTGSNDQTAKMWDADPSSDNFGKEVKTFEGHKGRNSYFNSVFVSGDYLFMGGSSNPAPHTVKMWDISEFIRFRITHQ